jgi:hypothetical protein
MAKYDPVNDLPHPDRTIVNSRAYGEHTRARRGTRSKVEVNETLKMHAVLLTGANTPARLVKNEIDRYRAGFPSGQLWQFLVGMFKRQLKMKLPLSVDQLTVKDIARYYPMSRLLKQGMNKTVTSNPNTVTITLEKLHPQFRRKALDGYMVEVAVMYFDFEIMESTSDSSVSAIVPLNHPGKLSFELSSGKPGERYLISIKLMGCMRTEIQTDNSYIAMNIIETGIVGQNGLEKSRY